MNNDILDIMFETRSEELSKLNEENKEFLNFSKVNFEKNYKDFVNSLENLLEIFKRKFKYLN